MWPRNQTTRWVVWMTLVIIFCSSATEAFGKRARTARGVDRFIYKTSYARIRQNPELTDALRKNMQQILNGSSITDTAVRIRSVRQELRGVPSAMRRAALNVISFELNETIEGRPLEEFNLTYFDKQYLEMRNKIGEKYAKEVLEKTKREIRYEGLLFDNHIQILKIKNQLDQLDYLKNDGTAEWDKSFTDAIKRFQSENGLEVDGIPGPKTQKKLDEKIRKINLGLLPWGLSPHLVT